MHSVDNSAHNGLQHCLDLLCIVEAICLQVQAVSFSPPFANKSLWPTISAMFINFHKSFQCDYKPAIHQQYTSNSYTMNSRNGTEMVRCICEMPSETETLSNDLNSNHFSRLCKIPWPQYGKILD